MPQSDGATAQAQDKAQEAAGQAKQQAQQAAGQAKDQIRTQVDQRSTQAGEQVSQQASDIRTVAEQLREQGKDKPAQLAEQAADRAERLGTYLQDADGDRILGDVEDFARQKPWAVIAGGVALGFAASRFLKASQSDRYQSRTSIAGPTAGTPAATSGTPAVPPTAGITPTGNELASGVTAPRERPAAAPPSAHPATPVRGGI